MRFVGKHVLHHELILKSIVVFNIFNISLNELNLEYIKHKTTHVHGIHG